MVTSGLWWPWGAGHRQGLWWPVGKEGHAPQHQARALRGCQEVAQRGFTYLFSNGNWVSFQLFTVSRVSKRRSRGDFAGGHCLSPKAAVGSSRIDGVGTLLTKG